MLFKSSKISVGLETFISFAAFGLVQLFLAFWIQQHDRDILLVIGIGNFYFVLAKSSVFIGVFFTSLILSFPHLYFGHFRKWKLRSVVCKIHFFLSAASLTFLQYQIEFHPGLSSENQVNGGLTSPTESGLFSPNISIFLIPFLFFLLAQAILIIHLIVLGKTHIQLPDEPLDMADKTDD